MPAKMSMHRQTCVINSPNILWQVDNKVHFGKKHHKRNWNMPLLLALPVRKILFANCEWFFSLFFFFRFFVSFCCCCCSWENECDNVRTYLNVLLAIVTISLPLATCYTAEANDMILMLTCNRCFPMFVCQNQARTNRTRKEKYTFSFVTGYTTPLRLQFTTPTTF